MHEYMIQAALQIRYMYIYKGGVAASDPDRVSARTDSLSMPRSLGWRSFSNRLPAHSLHECHVFRYVHGMIMGKQYLRHACPAPESWLQRPFRRPGTCLNLVQNAWKFLQTGAHALI